MIVEHASIVVAPGQEAAFERAVAEAARTVLPQARGFRGLLLHRCVEEPGRYVCALEWERLEDHTVRFREGPLFPAWRALVGPHFAQPPEVRHYEILPTP